MKGEPFLCESSSPSIPGKSCLEDFRQMWWALWTSMEGENIESQNINGFSMCNNIIKNTSVIKNELIKNDTV